MFGGVLTGSKAIGYPSNKTQKNGSNPEFFEKRPNAMLQPESKAGADHSTAANAAPTPVELGQTMRY